MNSNDFKLGNEQDCILREFKKGDRVTIEKAFDKISHNEKTTLDDKRRDIKLTFNQLILRDKAKLEHRDDWIDFEELCKRYKTTPKNVVIDFRKNPEARISYMEYDEVNDVDLLCTNNILRTFLWPYEIEIK